MLHNDAAQQRAGEQPASAPKESQKSPRAQTAAKHKTSTLKLADSCHGDMVATALRDRSMDTTGPDYSLGKSPPMTHEPMTHVTRQWPLHPVGPMASPPLAPMYQRQPARCHSLGDGHGQAHSVFGLELGTGQQQQPQQEAEAQLQHPQYSTHNLHHKSMALPHPARHQPPGEGYVQDSSALGPEQSTGQQQLLKAATNTMLQHPNGWTKKSLIAPQQHARHHPLGEGYGHVREALGPERGTERQWPHLYGTMDLQQSSDNGKKPQTLTESSIRQH